MVDAIKIELKSEDLEKLKKVFADASKKITGSEAKIFWGQRAIAHRIGTLEPFTLKGNGQYKKLNDDYKLRKDEVTKLDVPILTGVNFKKKKIGGRLKKAVSGREVVAKDTILNISSKGFESGTNLPYARYVQETRPFLFLTKKYVDLTVRNLEEFIMQGFK